MLLVDEEASNEMSSGRLPSSRNQSGLPDGEGLAFGCLQEIVGDEIIASASLSASELRRDGPGSRKSSESSTADPCAELAGFQRDVAGGGRARRSAGCCQEDEAAGSIVGGAGGGERCAIITRGVVDNDDFGCFGLGEGAWRRRDRSLQRRARRRSPP